MTRIYTWRLAVRSYEGDAWGMVPAAGVLRYFEQVAVAAASDGGYGAAFHREHGSAWIVRRVTLLVHAPARQGDELEITTWASHFVKVRGGREYKIRNATTGEVLYTGITEWVYVSRSNFAPLAIPPHLGKDFDVPGAPLQNYDPPRVDDHDKRRIESHLQTPGTENSPPTFTGERTAEWHEVDSYGHINNAHYADWLDDAMRAAMVEMGQSVEAMQQQGLHLRGVYYNLNYRRAALPGDRLRITTRIENASDSLYAVRQEITDAAEAVVFEANSVYGVKRDA